MRGLTVLWVLGIFHLLASGQNTSLADSILHLVDKQKTYAPKMDTLHHHIQNIYNTHYDETIELARHGYGLASQQNDTSNMGNFLRLIGLSMGKKGQIDSASVYFFRALDMLEKGGDQGKLGLLYDDIARMYRKLQQPNRALEYYDKALNLYEQANDLEGIARITNESGVIFRDRGEYETANAHFEKSLQLQIQRNDSVGIGYALEFLGYNQLLVENYALAETYFKQALSIREQKGDIFPLMLSYTALGEYYMHTGQHQVSNRYFEKSNALSIQIGFTDIQQYNHQQITLNYEALLDYKNAYHSLIASNSLKDSLYNIQKIKDVEEITTRYETEKKEARIKTQQVLIQKEKKEKYLYTTVLAFGMMLLLTLIFYVRNKHRHKTQLLLKEQNELTLNKVLEAEEKERGRIAKDLHDGIVQDITALKHHLHRLHKSDMDAELGQLEHDLTGIANELRNISYQMMPLTLKEFGLVKALETLLERTLSGLAYTYDFDAIHLNESLSEKVEISVYRICQELLNNSIKHSKANHISLLLLQKNGILHITYEDNGMGFDARAVKKGIGLNSLQSRLDMLKGTLTFQDADTKGCTASIRIPL